MRPRTCLMIWIAAAAWLTAPQAEAARLVGHWTFDYYQGTDPLANKASDVRWDSLTLKGSGATVSDGKLALARYQSSGTWKQSCATTLLRTDLGAGGYFKEMTQIVWLKWPGFSTTLDWARLTTLIKLSTSNYNPTNLANSVAAQSIVMKATDNWNWGSNRKYEYLNSGALTNTSTWAKNGGTDPPTDRYIKLAQVIKYVDATQYQQLMYWDIGDGSGLVQISSAVSIPAANVNSFGQCNTDCLVDATGGKRYDGFGIMDYCWSLPQSAGEIDFDEVQLYSGALTQSEISSLTARTYTPNSVQRGQWWDELPRAVATGSLQTALDYHANMAMNKVAEDPNWGLWFTNVYASADNATRQTFESAGIRSIGYREGFGEIHNVVTELIPGLPSTLLHHFWNWYAYTGGTIMWSGSWTWFDDAVYARPYTRTHPVYGGFPMTYPDGTVATGFTDNDQLDVRKSNVYDAGCSDTILGDLDVFQYTDNATVTANGGPYDGLLYVDSLNKYIGHIMLEKDIACPYWDDYSFASTLMTVSEVGEQGIWTDNMSPFSSFLESNPVTCAFGKWSVARFRTYLEDHFTEAQLRTMGVLGATQTYADLANFDVKAYFRTLASSNYGWNGTSLTSSAWKNSGWANEPVWRAYEIFKRQIGTQALADLYSACKQAAAMGGRPDYLFLGNDPALTTLGWLRGSVDMSTSELMLGWHPSSGTRGFGLPPFARLSPTYKATRDQSKSRFVNIWLYSDNYENELALTEVANVIYYEMLATHTMPKFYADSTSYNYAGNPTADKAFFKFVAEQASPEFGARTPVEEIGVYASTSSILSQYTPGGVLNFDAQPHHFAVWGWATALAELHYQYRVVLEWHLTRDMLRTLNALIIPNSVVFDPADVAVLDAWVREDGGILIVTGDSGSRLPESGNFDTTSSLILGPLTGVSNWSTAPTSNTVVLGNGRVRFIKDNIGLTYFNATASGRATQLAAFANEMSSLLTAENDHTAIISTDAPKTVGLTLYDDSTAGKLFLDVNNFNVTIAPDGLSATIAPTPTVNVTIGKPAWWNQFQSERTLVYAISPSGPVAIGQPSVYADRIELQVPSTTYYTSVIMRPVSSLGFAKALTNGSRVSLESQIVTAVFDDCLYVESADRASGIRVAWSGSPVAVGRLVSVTGMIDSTADGEMFVQADSVIDTGAGTVDPVAMTNKNLGGGDFHYVAGSPSSGQRGVWQGDGLNNIGLLTKVYGTVTGVGSGFFCISDGSEVTDFSGFKGIRVQCGTLRSPDVGEFATVIGISTLYGANGATYRCIRPRIKADIQVPISARIAGQWDFEGAQPLTNKAPDVTWDSLTLTGTGASVSGGALVLPRYQSGSTWYQSSATTMLKTDLAASGYFTEMTQVAWFYWPGFSASHYGRLFGLYKFNSPSYTSGGLKAAEALLWGSYSNQRWRDYGSWEYWSGSSVVSTSSYYDYAATSNPPADVYIKVAQALKKIDASTYELKLYWDTGAGIAQIGNTITIPAANVNAFGQYNTDCLINASGGKRYDGFGIMDATYRVPASAGAIYFDEIRLYNGALSASQIDAL
ncbi:MAG: hypothetical protein ACYC64_04415 [Armatimonadota bacterium]